MTGRGGGDGLVLTQAGPLHSHWLATGRVTGRHPRCINWKCLRFWDTPTWNNSTDTKYSWMPHTYLTGWIVISLSSSLNYHPSVSVHDIQQKGLKISVYAFTHPDRQPCYEGDAFPCVHAWRLCHLSITHYVIWGHMNHVITIITLTKQRFSVSRSTNLTNSEIFIAKNNAFFIGTAYVVEDAVVGITMGYHLHYCTCRFLCRCAWLPGEPMALTPHYKLSSN